MMLRTVPPLANHATYEWMMPRSKRRPFSGPNVELKIQPNVRASMVCDSDHGRIRSARKALRPRNEVVSSRARARPSAVVRTVTVRAKARVRCVDGQKSGSRRMEA